MVYTSTLRLFRQIRDEIKPIYGQEADMLAMLIVEDVSGFSSTDILTDHKFLTGPNFRSSILKYIRQLKKQVPIQYILGKAYFFDNIFEVNENTLIPRSETEELVQLVLNYLEGKDTVKVLDIGVGSGCIAISIALKQPKARVEGLDISLSAIKVAEKNIEKLGAPVTLFKADILSYKANQKYDVIVSNPPYVLESEKRQMKKNVLKHEPAIALFVPDVDPLRYYKGIIEFTRDGLTDNGAIFFEVNELSANEVVRLLQAKNFQEISVVKDINGKDRFVHAIKRT
jgi:release factor glutamine methyltransferase